MHRCTSSWNGLAEQNRYTGKQCDNAFSNTKLHFNYISVNYSNSCQEEINFWRKDKNNETYATFTVGELLNEGPLFMTSVENNLKADILTLHWKPLLA